MLCKTWLRLQENAAQNEGCISVKPLADSVILPIYGVDEIRDMFTFESCPFGLVILDRVIDVRAKSRSTLLCS